MNPRKRRQGTNNLPKVQGGWIKPAGDRLAKAKQNRRQWRATRKAAAPAGRPASVLASPGKTSKRWRRQQHFRQPERKGIVAETDARDRAAVRVARRALGRAFLADGRCAPFQSVSSGFWSPCVPHFHTTHCRVLIQWSDRWMQQVLLQHACHGVAYVQTSFPFRNIKKRGAVVYT